MPRKERHDRETEWRISTTLSKVSKRDAGLQRTGEAMSASIKLRRSKERDVLDRVKRQ